MRRYYRHAQRRSNKPKPGKPGREKGGNLSPDDGKPKHKQEKERKTMANDNISKREFIQVYQWMYGTSKTEAEYIWKISSYEYKALVMETYINLMAEKAIYNG